MSIVTTQLFQEPWQEPKQISIKYTVQMLPIRFHQYFYIHQKTGVIITYSFIDKYSQVSSTKILTKRKTQHWQNKL